MKEDQSRQRHNGAGAKAPRQVGETAGRPVCLEHSEGEGEGEREADPLWGSPGPLRSSTGRTSWQEEAALRGGACSSLGRPVPGLVLWAWAPGRGETPLPSSCNKQAEVPGKGLAGDPTVAERWSLDSGLYLPAPYLPFPPTNSYLSFKAQLQCPLPLTSSVPGVPQPRDLPLLVVGLRVSPLDHGPFGACPQPDSHWSPELTLEVATEQVNGREGDGETGSK